MLINQIEFRHLEYFVTLADTLHYGKASEKLFVSQSALSQQIKRLEMLLGESLFDRTNRRVELSTAGVLFRDEAEKILHQRNHSLERWKLAISGIKGLLKIGFVGSAMRSYLPPKLQRFAEIQPDVKFQLEELNNREQLRLLEMSQIDIGFMRSNQIPPALKIQSVDKENFSLVLPQDHRITEKNFKNFNQLSDESFILFPNNDSHMYYGQILNLCAIHGFSPKISHRSVNGTTIFKLVESGLGISVVPNCLRDEQNYQVRFIELKNIAQQTELFAVWNKDNSNPDLNHFLELL